MNHGKTICNQLKEIRRGIARDNGIELDIPECTFEGECEGTCPRCEAELQYLERELTLRTVMGKAAVVAGLTLGISGGTLTAAAQDVAPDRQNHTKSITDIKPSKSDTCIFKGSIIDSATGEPLIFANVVLADEINRATPKTQSALLEAMQEHTVTVGDVTYALPDPFFVIATQNPIEQEGTYPLPEAQLDRFAMKLLVEYPTKQELAAIVNLTEGFGVQPAQPVISPEQLIEIRQMIQQIPIAEPVMDRALTLVMNTHAENKYIREGASPRAAQYIVRCAKARSFMLGRLNVAFEDIDYVAPAVLRHRIITSFDAVADGVTPDQIIAQL